MNALSTSTTVRWSPARVGVLGVLLEAVDPAQTDRVLVVAELLDGLRVAVGEVPALSDAQRLDGDPGVGDRDLGVGEGGLGVGEGSPGRGVVDPQRQQGADAEQAGDEGGPSRADGRTP
jgi:hypothetical protein